MQRSRKISISEIIIIKFENGLPRGVTYQVPQTNLFAEELEKLLDRKDVKKRAILELWH